MTLRRDFLYVGGAAAGAAMLRTTASAASVPPSISALQSMRSQVHPITTDERRARIAKAQELMSRRAMDALLLAGGTSLLYFTGVRWYNSERLFAVAIPSKGRAFCICPSFEEDRAREQLNAGPLEAAEVMTWHEDESPYRLVAAGLKERAAATGTLGIEERTPFVFSNGVAQAVPSAKLVSATPVTAGCRMIKSPHELELMSIANQATLRVYEAVYRVLTPGMTQNDAQALIAAAYNRVGFRGEASVQTGPYSALPHGS